MQETSDMPWLIFEIEKTFYALSCANIQSIVPAPEKSNQTQIPDVPHYIRGLTKVREDIIPMIGLRELYNIPSVIEEYETFKTLIEQRKAEHEQWINELERCTKNGETFSLATDPHLCPFGKWYYNYESLNSSVSFILNKIEEPHRKFHESGLEVLHCAQETGSAREAHLKAAFHETKNVLMPEVLNLLDAVKDIFSRSYEEKMIILKNDEKAVGIIVDDVKAIDHIDVIDGQEEFVDNLQNQYIASIGRGKKTNDLIMMLHADELLSLLRDSNAPAAQ